MVRVPVTYSDIDGFETTETLYFSTNASSILKIKQKYSDILNQPSVLKLAEDHKNGTEVTLEDVKALNLSEDTLVETILSILDDIIDVSYGVRTADNKFQRSEQATKEFKGSAAYDALINSFTSDAIKLQDFIKNMVSGQ